MRNELVQFLVDLPGLVRQTLCKLGILLFILAFWACLIGICLAVLYEVFLSPPTPSRVLTTSDLWWIIGLVCFFVGFVGPVMEGASGKK